VIVARLAKMFKVLMPTRVQGSAEPERAHTPYTSDESRIPRTVTQHWSLSSHASLTCSMRILGTPPALAQENANPRVALETMKLRPRSRRSNRRVEGTHLWNQSPLRPPCRSHSGQYQRRKDVAPTRRGSALRWG
jgi:hypothetical protein